MWRSWEKGKLESEIEVLKAARRGRRVEGMASVIGPACVFPLWPLFRDHMMMINELMLYRMLRS